MPVRKRFAFTDLPARVQEALVEVGRMFAGQGAELLLFGSFARGTAGPRSDLDIAVRWKEVRDKRGTWFKIQDEIENLPTIRPVDLVDLDSADPALRSEALQFGIPLERLRPGTNGKALTV